MPPYLLLSLLLGTTYGVLFHIWRGKTIKDMLLYLLAGVIGFGLGQLLGEMMALDFMRVGPLHLIEASAVSWVSLFLAHWLKI